MKKSLCDSSIEWQMIQSHLGQPNGAPLVQYTSRKLAYGIRITKNPLNFRISGPSRPGQHRLTVASHLRCQVGLQRSLAFANHLTLTWRSKSRGWRETTSTSSSSKHGFPGSSKDRCHVQQLCASNMFDQTWNSGKIPSINIGRFKRQ